MSILFKIFKPLIMALPPETAHGLSLRFLPFLRPAKRSDLILETQVGGLKFKNPIGMAAGYDKDGRVPKALLKLGFGFVEVGTLTPKPQAGNAKPRIFRLKEDKAVINRLGFNNKGFEAAQNRLKAFSKETREGILGVNIGANKNSSDPVSDYVRGIETFRDFADYFTVNISSPNTPGLRDLQKKKNFEALLKNLKQALGKEEGKNSPPLFIKIAPELSPSHLKDIVSLCLKNGVSGLVISNTTTERPSTLKSENRAEEGGLSGTPLFEKSTALLRRAYQFSEGKLILIGVGGISNAEQAYEKILNGASLVQLYTGLVYGGPGLVEDISEGLAALLKKNGFASAGEAVGKGIKH